MSPTILSLILSSLATGTIITMSSHHWLMAWMGLEINTLAIIPLMAKKHHPRATEAATKYFLIQAAAAAMILFSSSINAWLTGQWDISQPMNPYSTALLTTALAMKLGLAPLHLWLPEILQGSTLYTAMIITTWQKLAPLSILLTMQQYLNPTLLMTLGVMSTLIGGWGGLNQTQLRKIMAFSSIAHLGWMTMVLTFLPTLTTLNLLLYIIMTLTTFLIMITMKLKTIQNMATTWATSPLMTIMLMLTILSLGGLPPMTGFAPKWMILQELITQHKITLATLTALSSLLSLFFYLRLSYITTLTLSPNNISTPYKWRLKSKTKTTIIQVMLTLSILLLPLTPAMI